MRSLSSDARVLGFFLPLGGEAFFVGRKVFSLGFLLFLVWGAKNLVFTKNLAILCKVVGVGGP